MESLLLLCDGIKSLILNSGKHLEGLKRVVNELHPGYDHKLGDTSSKTMAKLICGRIMTDSCTSAQNLNALPGKAVMAAAKENLEAAK